MTDKPFTKQDREAVLFNLRGEVPLPYPFALNIAERYEATVLGLEAQISEWRSAIVALPSFIPVAEKNMGRMAGVQPAYSTSYLERVAVLALLAPRLVLTCPKIPHDDPGGGYLHDAADDSPYDVDGVLYCGRCHFLCGPNGRCQREEACFAEAKRDLDADTLEGMRQSWDGPDLPQRCKGCGNALPCDKCPDHWNQ